MNRREFMRAMGTGAMGLMTSGCISARRSGSTGSERPNILFIMSDDHAAHALSCYGSKVNMTPNLDRIAQEGIRLDNCFCTNAICTPSRATILTGKYSHKNGCYTLADTLDRRHQTFPRLLQRAGYRTGIVGKWHLKSEPAGFADYKIGAGYFDPAMRVKGEPWRKAVRREGYSTDMFTDMALDFMKKGPNDRPFCLLLHYSAPHDDWRYDKKHADIYADRDVPEPDNLLDKYENRGNAIKRSTEQLGNDCTTYEKETGHLSGDARRKAQYQIYMKSYIRCVASIDDNVARLLDHLDEAGLTDNTIVAYSSDQGFFLGDHGLFDKRFMYEESLRIPFLVRYPKEIGPGSVSDDLVTNVDFAETLLDYGGLPIPEDMQGRSIRPVLRGRTPDDWPTSMYYRYWMHRGDFNIAAHYGVRTKRHKLIYFYGLRLGIAGARGEATEPEWELFDLAKDPREMNSVYNDPAYADVVRELKKELLRLKKQVDDTDDRYPELAKQNERAW